MRTIAIEEHFLADGFREAMNRQEGSSTRAIFARIEEKVVGLAETTPSKEGVAQTATAPRFSVLLKRTVTVLLVPGNRVSESWGTDQVIFGSGDCCWGAGTGCDAGPGLAAILTSTIVRSNALTRLAILRFGRFIPSF